MDAKTVQPQALALFKSPASLALGLVLGSGLLLVCLLGSILLGAADIAPGAVWQAVFQFDGSTEHLIIRTVRLPRAILAVMVGAALAGAGAITQGLTRNPLAAPDILGINVGAALAIVLAVFWRGSGSYVWVAFGGAAIAAITVYCLGSMGRTGLTPLKLVIAGSALYLDNLSLSDNLAQGLGSRVERTRSLLLLCTVALAGASVATVGNVGFVGLMAPHLARRLVGPAHIGLLPVAALLGACIVELADLVGRLAFAPIELPCGVITAVIGAPYFLWLLYRTRNQ